jgi:hypothetical protein
VATCMVAAPSSRSEAGHMNIGNVEMVWVEADRNAILAKTLDGYRKLGWSVTFIDLSIIPECGLNDRTRVEHNDPD